MGIPLRKVGDLTADHSAAGHGLVIASRFVTCSNLDPVTLTVIQNGLVQVCNEMDLAFVRAAFSPVISEGMDRSDGIYDRRRRADRQGEGGLPVFVGTMQFSTGAVIERS
jgi:N-methylhydantoinase B